MEKGHTIKVLDHGYVKLIEWLGSDEGLIEAARMSTGRGFEGWYPGEVCARCRLRKGNAGADGVCFENKGENDHEWVKVAGDQKLLTFLYSNFPPHSSPFEMAELHVEVQAPIMVFREFHRHRTFSFNEMSARYIQMPNLHYVPELSRFQKQSTANKQGSAGVMDDSLANHYRQSLEAQQEEIYTSYDSMVADGLAKEVARLNTPVSRYSRMRAKTDLWNWLSFLNKRMRPNAQWEMRQVADAAAEIVKALWPRSYALFEEWDLHAVKFSRSEMNTLRELLGAQATTRRDDPVYETLRKKIGC